MSITINGSGSITGLTAGGLPNGSITTDDLAADAVTSAKIATDAVTSGKISNGTIVDADVNASAAIADSKLTGTTCKAWVNFDGTSNSANLSGTYSQSGTTVTVTATAHGLIVGSSIYSDITSGTGVDGTYTVATVLDADTFTYTAGTSLTTSGNITLRRNTIRASYNVSSITDNGTGDYTVNFTTEMPDDNYCPVYGIINDEPTTVTVTVCTSEATGAVAVDSLRISSMRGGSGNLKADKSQIYVAIFR